MNPPTYTTLVDDSFARADTLPAPGNNSTAGVGNGWIDLVGSTYCLQAAAGGLIRSRPMPGTPRGVAAPLYHSTSASVVNGKVRLYTNSPQIYDRGAVFRASFHFGESAGYYAGVNRNNIFFIAKMVKDFQSELVKGVAAGVMIPAGCVIEATCQQLDAGRTQLTVAIFDPTELAASEAAVPLTQRSCIDTEPSLQNAAGMMGISSAGYEFDAARVTLFSAA